MTNWPGRRTFAIRGASTTRRTTFGESCSRSTTGCNGTSLVLVTAGSSPTWSRPRYLPMAPRHGPKVTTGAGRPASRVRARVRPRARWGRPPPTLPDAPVADWSSGPIRSCEPMPGGRGPLSRRVAADRAVQPTAFGSQASVTASCTGSTHRSPGRCRRQGAQPARGCRRTASAPSPPMCLAPGCRGRRSSWQAPRDADSSQRSPRPPATSTRPSASRDGDRARPWRRERRDLDGRAPSVRVEAPHRGHGCSSSDPVPPITRREPSASRTEALPGGRTDLPAMAQVPGTGS